jgi:O-antigen ligase
VHLEYNNLLLSVVFGSAIVVLGLCFKYPKEMFFTAIVALPFHRIIGGIELGIITFDAFGAIVLLLFFSFGVKLLLGIEKYKLEKIDWYLIGFCVLSAFACSINGGDYIKRGYYYWHTFLIPAFSYFLIRQYVVLEKDILKIVIFFLLATTIASIFSWVEYAQYSLRTASVLNSAREASKYFILSLFFAFILLKSKKIGITIFVFVGISNLGALVFAASRAAVVFFILSFIPFVLFNINKRSVIFRKVMIIQLIIIASISTFALLAYFRETPSAKSQMASETGFNRLTNIYNWSNSIGLRIKMWQSGMDYWRKNPVFGYGGGKIEDNTSRISVFGKKQSPFISSYHNLIIELLAQMGIAGLIWFHGILIYIFSYPFSKGGSSMLYSIINVALLVILIIYGDGLTNGIFHGISMYLVWILFGVIFSANKVISLTKENVGEKRNERLVYTAAIT